VKVTIEDDLLFIAGEKKVEHIDDKTHFSKRSYGSFTRFLHPAGRRRSRRHHGEVWRSRKARQRPRRGC